MIYIINNIPHSIMLLILSFIAYIFSIGFHLYTLVLYVIVSIIYVLAYSLILLYIAILSYCLNSYFLAVFWFISDYSNTILHILVLFSLF
jgi:hypothetical protein